MKRIELYAGKRIKLAGVGLVILILFGQAVSAFYDHKDFRKLDVLIGTWEMKTQKGAYFETWDRNGSKAFSGRSYKTRGTDTTVLENVRLYIDDQQIIYAPTTHGQNQDQEVPFKLVTIQDKKFIFENLKHDFPQRIIYHFTTNDSLHAYIEGQVKQKMQRLDFYYARQK